MAKKFSYYTNERLEAMSNDDPSSNIPFKQKEKLYEMIAELSYMLLQERIQRKELVEDIKREVLHRTKEKTNYYFNGLTF